MIKIPYNDTSLKILHCPKKEEFLSLLKLAEEPFKVTGSINDWFLFRILSKLKDPIDKCDYLASLALNEEVYFTVLPTEQKGVLSFNEKLEQNFSFKSQKALFPEFINQVKRCLEDPNLGTLYLQSTPIIDLNNKLGPLNLFEGFSPMSQPRFWIGTGNQFLTLHNDPYRNIIALFTGRKRVIMFPPEELPNIYPAPFDKRIGGVFASLVDVYNPDLAKFPLFSQALQKLKVAVVNPGEFLYMPPLWWHAVEGEGFNVGLNCWFMDDGKEDKIRNLYLPSESLLLGINSDLISDINRNKLYNNFKEAIDTDIEISKFTNKIEFQVVKEAKRIKFLINNSLLSKNQKDAWRQWVYTFAFHYIFCIKNNVFPTLHYNEFSNMIKRLKRSKKHRTIKSIHRTIKSILILCGSSNFLNRLMKKKKVKHGIVPFLDSESE